MEKKRKFVNVNRTDGVVVSRVGVGRVGVVRIGVGDEATAGAAGHALVQRVIALHAANRSDAATSQSVAAHRVIYDGDIAKVCAVVDMVFLKGVDPDVLEEVHSTVKAKIIRNPACLARFSGRVSLLAYLRSSVVRAYRSHLRKERRGKRASRNGEFVDLYSPSGEHAKQLSARDLGYRTEVASLIAEDLHEKCFTRRDPTRAGRPVGLRGAINDHGLVDGLRAYADVVIACSKSESPRVTDGSFRGVAELASMAGRSTDKRRDIAYDGHEVLSGLCDACLAEIEAMGSAIKSATREELRRIRADLYEVGRRINGLLSQLG